MFSRLPISVSTLQEVGILSTWVCFLPLGGLRGCLGDENWDFRVSALSLPRRRHGSSLGILSLCLGEGSSALAMGLA